MTRSAQDITSALQALAPTSDAADNVHRLNEALEGFDKAPGADAVTSALFALLERFPEADFGTPGPLAHVLEAQAAYASQLADSLARRPTELTAWLANRLLNLPLPREDRTAWLQRMTVVASHPLASGSVRESAIRFLDFQASRSGRPA
jgi:hypothetical protein